MIPSYRTVLRRRSLHEHHLVSYSTAQSTDAIRHNLRALLRETAQPVAVVTSLMPLPAESGPHPTHPRFHGATLSSFSSIALDPHPLVAFSLRVPSRMATALRSAHAAPPAPAPAPAHMVVNILSAAQEAVAVRFARPDLHPAPFATTAYALTQEGLPVLEGALGALSCRLVAASWPLHDLELLQGRSGGRETPWEGDGVASELFIAAVTRVESLSLPGGDDQGLRTSPLLYHRRAYATTCQIPLVASSKKS
ncbi:hypothetical protein AcW1_006899 [Taiwanofungus camphoratus]|nr:hypothetical protein AcW1_006899 [Antrodia cinnamomea]KAI0955270.1 hypothetical protein AcW1_006899 [Antrodia cinnamomea]